MTSRLDMVVNCTRCRRPIPGALIFNEANQIIDSVGFIAFVDGPVCDACLGGDAASDSEWAQVHWEPTNKAKGNA